MATIRLIPSSCTVSNASYVSLTDTSNMYANTDSTNYGTITHNRATGSTYYAYLMGFNFADIPSDATVNSFTVKIKASAQGHTTSTSSSYYMSLVQGTNHTQIGNTSADGRLSTTTTIFTFANGSLTWSQVVGYGANFGIRIPLRRASTNTADVVSVYGAEIEVTYTVPIPHDISVTNNSSTALVTPTGTHTVYEGDEFSVTISNVSNLNDIEIKDNGNDVKSQLVLHPSGQETQTFHLDSLDEATGTIYQGSSYNNAIGKSYTNSSTDSSTGYTRMSVSTQTVHMKYNFDCSSIPQNATITNVSCTAKVRGGSTSHIQLYSGNVAKGSAYTLPSTGETTINLTCGTWTREELNSAKFYFEGNSNGGSNSIRLWGVDLVITYTSSEYYSYTISNISADHTILISDAQSNKMYMKVNGDWVGLQKVHKKINGSWVEQTDLTNVFESGKIYVRNQ